MKEKEPDASVEDAQRIMNVFYEIGYENPDIVASLIGAVLQLLDQGDVTFKKDLEGAGCTLSFVTERNSPVVAVKSITFSRPVAGGADLTVKTMRGEFTLPRIDGLFMDFVDSDLEIYFVQELSQWEQCSILGVAKRASGKTYFTGRETVNGDLDTVKASVL